MLSYLVNRVFTRKVRVFCNTLLVCSLRVISNNSMKFINVKTGKSRDRFELKVEAGIGFIEYVKKDGIYYLMHTEVPETLKGQGIATLLANKSFEYLESINATIVPYCPFIVGYLKKNDQWSKLVK